MKEENTRSLPLASRTAVVSCFNKTMASSSLISKPDDAASRRGGLLAGMRIRKKLMFLHTCFSLVLAFVLALALWPAIGQVVKEAEVHEARVLAAMVAGGGPSMAGINPASLPEGAKVELRILTGDGPAPADPTDQARFERIKAAGRSAEPESGGGGGVVLDTDGASTVGLWDAANNRAIVLTVRLENARAAVRRLYFLVTVALLAVYGLVAAALEIFVLPQHVYGPIGAVLEADHAARAGRREAELIPDAEIPADEMGEIMRSHNSTLSQLRRHEADLARALAQLEEVANDLRRKNHLLEMAKRNLADQDRLASLGMMSAGIAHELNTPLAVLKGMVERVRRSVSRGAGVGGAPVQEQGPAANGKPNGVSPDEAELMVRVVGRIERLSESLLDFARVRPSTRRPEPLAPIVNEAWTLVSLDREVRDVAFSNTVPGDLLIDCDPDRILQVFVNLLRNAADAVVDAHAERASAQPPGGVAVAAATLTRDGRDWASVTVTDDGAGIAPEALERLFQPFVSTRLDARGTGLGLAVAEGIVHEHGGVILARNRPPAENKGAVFEVLLPRASAVAVQSGETPAGDHL